MCLKQHTEIDWYSMLALQHSWIGAYFHYLMDIFERRYLYRQQHHRICIFTAVIKRAAAVVSILYVCLFSSFLFCFFFKFQLHFYRYWFGTTPDDIAYAYTFDSVSVRFLVSFPGLIWLRSRERVNLNWPWNRFFVFVLVKQIVFVVGFYWCGFLIIIK